MINLLMHINIPQRENRGGILKMHLLNALNTWKWMARDLGLKVFSLNIENHKSIW